MSKVSFLVPFFLVGLLSFSLGHSMGYVRGAEWMRDKMILERKPMPPATICTMKMPSSKYRQLDCVRHAWRAK